MVGIVHRLIEDSGDIPNNPRLPLILYRDALAFATDDPDAEFQDVFRANGWGHGWRDGVILSRHHYHAEAHEVVGIARGRATLQFGGPGGPVFRVEAGDAALIPAGVGHCRLDDAPGLSVVGAYPPGRSPDTRYEGETAKEAIRSAVHAVPLPATDPLTGADGAVPRLWGRTPAR